MQIVIDVLYLIRMNFGRRKFGAIGAKWQKSPN